MTQHPVIAFPSSGTWLPLTIRQSLASGFAWTVTDADDLRNLDIGAAALTINAVMLGGSVFTYDSADASTADDGVTCLVSSDGKRFKTGSIGSAPIAVQSRATATPPGSPTLGDWYRIPASPTGDWSANADDLTVYTGSGWQFVSPAPGMLIYVRDAATYEHWTEGGAWADGIGTSTLPDGSVLPVKLEWPLGVVVEAEQAAPPAGTPSAGAAYIVGASATGDWAGHDTKVARADGSGGWTFLAGYEGAQLFNKGVGTNVEFRSGAWIAVAGAYGNRIEQRVDAETSHTVEDNGNVPTGSTYGYQYSSSTGPASNDKVRAIDDWQPSVSANKANAEFELEVSARIKYRLSGTGSTGLREISKLVIAVFVDTETTPRDWFEIGESPVFNIVNNVETDSAEFEIHKRLLLFSLADTSAHTIKVRYFARLESGGGNAVLAGIKTLRERMILREAS